MLLLYHEIVSIHCQTSVRPELRGQDTYTYDLWIQNHKESMKKSSYEHKYKNYRAWGPSLIDDGYQHWKHKNLGS